MPHTERAYDRVEVFSARDLPEALSLREEHPDAKILAGGTDLMVEMELGRVPAAVIDIHSVEELRGVRERPGGLWLGALTTHRTLAESLLVESWSPCLVEACKTVGAIQIQSRGTLGGNIANASPAGDTLPVLMALDAEVEVASAARGTRRIPMAYLFEGYRSLCIEPDELLVGILLPEPHVADRTHFRKVGTRLAQAISKVVMGARVRVVNGVVTEARVAFGSVGPTPVRCTAVEEALVGRAIDPQAARLVEDAIQPINDVRSTAHYRSRVARNVLASWLMHLTENCEEDS
ncbi:MAG: xanthine dehydrogenase family protein subunit M [Myxococcota bacterium]|nr:xanthine dehydrogenase family protein subunit M [Myxococcota bacterium]